LILPNDSDAYLDPERDHPKKCPECGNITAEDDGVADWPNDLVEIFVLADKYNVPLLRREAVVTIQHLDEISHTYPSAWLSCNAFERLPDTSPFCRYVVNMLKLWWDPESKTCPSCEDGNTVNFDAETMPRSLMFQMLKASHHRNEDGTLKIGKVNWCDYHEHGGKEEVRACRAKRKLEGRFGKFESLDGEDDSSDNESSGDKDMDQES
jgi:hypothetical protein